MDTVIVLAAWLSSATLASAAGQPMGEGASAAPTSSGLNPKGASLASHYSVAERSNILETHAVLGSLAWVIAFPLGAIFFKVLNSRRLFWIHTAVQTLGMCLALGNFGLGLFIAIIYHKALNNQHTIIGVIVLGLMLLQPIWGFIQHAHFKKHKTASWWGKGHRWIGRLTITLAMINGGLGFWLARKQASYRTESAIAYGVGAGIIFVIWIAIVVIVDVSKSKGEMKDAESRDTPSETGSQSVSKEMITRITVA